MTAGRFLAVLGFGVVLCFFSVAAQAAPPPKNPIAWTPASVELTVARGSGTTAPASFTSSKKLPNVTITATGGVSAFVTPSPSALDSVSAGTPVSVNLAVSVSASTALGDYAGAVQVVSNKKVVADSLPVTIHVVAPAGHIYWANGGIGRADLDGSNPNVDFIPISATGGSTGLAVDAQHIYWTDPNHQCPNLDRCPQIGRANLDGSSPNPSFIPLGATSGPIGMAVDATSIYWADPQIPAISRANLDGTNVNPSFIPLPPLASLPVEVAVDANHIYWTDQCRVVGPSQCVDSAIGRANLDGSNPDRDFIPSLGGLGATGIAVDAQHIYWGNTFIPGFFGAIGRANLDGSNPNPTFINLNTGGAAPIVGVAVDVNHIYWANTGPPSVIDRANLDGSNLEPGFINAGATYGLAVGD